MQEQEDRGDALIEVAARLRAMRERESSRGYAVPDYLADGWQRELRSECGRCDRREEDPAAPLSPSTSSNDVRAPDGDHRCSSSAGRISETWREKVCRWYYQVVDSYDFDREIVSVAASCLDRYLACHHVDHRHFRLAGMTALYLAIKLHSGRKLRLSCVVQMGGGAFTREQVEATELAMLVALRWHVNPVTPQAVCRELLNLLPSASVEDGGAHFEVRETALFLTELSVCDYWFATKSPSCVALAAVVLAIDLRHRSSSRRVDFLEQAVGIGMGDVVYSQGAGDCHRCLRSLYQESTGTGESPSGDSAERNCDPPVDRYAQDSPRGLDQLDQAVHVSTRASKSQQHQRR